jgi:hypothetical protein
MLSKAIEDSYRGAGEASLEKSTRGGAASAFNSWLRYCKMVGVDHTCGNLDGNLFNWNKMTMLIIGYISFEVGVRGLSPRSIVGAYVSNIMNEFIIRGWETIYFEQAVKCKRYGFFKRGFLKIYDKANPKCLQAKIPFTLFIALDTVAALRNMKCYRSCSGARYINGVEIALLIGIFFLLRKSEYLKDSDKKKNGLRFKSICFIDYLGEVIPWEKVGKVLARRVSLNVAFSKTDQSGYGRVLQHVRQEGSNICIVQKLEDWVVQSRDVYGKKESDYILECDDCVEAITSKIVTVVMKWGTRRLGLKDDKVSAHSLRYGGATMLAAAGLPHYLIAWYGGWTENSSTMRLYATLGDEAICLVTSTMCKQGLSDLSDLKIRMKIQLQRSRKD